MITVSQCPSSPAAGIGRLLFVRPAAATTAAAALGQLHQLRAPGRGVLARHASGAEIAAGHVQAARKVVDIQIPHTVDLQGGRHLGQLGRRRRAGIARAQGYGFNFEPYVKQWNEKSILIIQIESTRGIDNIEQIINHEQVDGAMIGPYDLSGSMGIPGQINHPRIKEAESVVINACKRHKKACGTQMIDPDKASVNSAFEKGYTFVVLASDIFALWIWSRGMKGILDSGVRQ